MGFCLSGSIGIDSSDELRVMQNVFFHFSVLAADWTVRNPRPDRLIYATRGPRHDGAVDDRQRRAVVSYVLSHRLNEGFAEGITNMKHRAIRRGECWFDVHADCRMVL